MEIHLKLYHLQEGTAKARIYDRHGRRGKHISWFVKTELQLWNYRYAMKLEEYISKYWGNLHKHQEIRAVNLLVFTYLGQQKGQIYVCLKI